MNSGKSKNTVIKAAFLPPPLVERLGAAFAMLDWEKLSEPEREKAAASARVLVVNGESVVPASFIARFPGLELIADFGVGYDGIDIAAARAQGVTVTNTPGVLTDDVADLGMALMLAVSRQIVDAQHFVERGDWSKGAYVWTKRVSGGRLGIAGMGRIGRTVARRAAGFDMAISYTDQAPLADCPYPFFPDLKSLAAEVEFLVMCVNGGERTRGMVNADVLKALGPQGILVNISRGSVVDETALVAAIAAGSIAGAGLDVFAHEPAVPRALQGRPNVVVTPHIASATHSTRQAMADLVFDNVAAHFAGQPLKTPLSPS